MGSMEAINEIGIDVVFMLQAGALEPHSAVVVCTTMRLRKSHLEVMEY